MKIIFGCTAALVVAALANAQPPSSGANAIVLAEPGYQVPSPSLSVAPGQIIVLHVHGITATFDSNVAATLGPNGFPHVLNGVSVDLVQGKAATATSLELHAAYQSHCIEPCSPVTGITLQIPFEIETQFAANGDPNPFLRISENGKPVGGVVLLPVTDNMHVMNTCDDTQVYISAAYTVPRSVCADAVTVGGAFNSLYNLAHGGDELTMWLYGIGAITPAAPNCCTSPDQLPKPVQKFALNFDFRPNAPSSPVVPGFGLTSDPLFATYAAGPYLVNFAVPPVPAGVPLCDGVRITSNLTVTITGPNSSAAAKICVAP
jgi:hypothetical protein